MQLNWRSVPRKILKVSSFQSQNRSTMTSDSAKHETVKIQVLKYNKFFLNLLGLYSNHQSLNQPSNKLAMTIRSSIILFGLAGLFCCSSIYVYHHKSNITLALRAVLLVCAALQCMGSYMSLKANAKIIQQFFRKVQDSVDYGKINLICCKKKLFIGC